MSSPGKSIITQILRDAYATRKRRADVAKKKAAPGLNIYKVRGLKACTRMSRMYPVAFVVKAVANAPAAVVPVNSSLDDALRPLG